MGEFISRFGNPWSAAEWNVTKQGQFLQAYGRRRADDFARQAGTTVGGPKPQGIGPRYITQVLVQKRVIVQGGQGGGYGWTGDGPPDDGALVES